jgi:hypothetical protein
VRDCRQLAGRALPLFFESISRIVNQQDKERKRKGQHKKERNTSVHTKGQRIYTAHYMFDSKGREEEYRPT